MPGYHPQVRGCPAPADCCRDKGLYIHTMFCYTTLISQGPSRKQMAHSKWKCKESLLKEFKCGQADDREWSNLRPVHQGRPLST